MPGVVARNSPNFNAHIVKLGASFDMASRPITGQVAALARNDGNGVSSALKMARKLMVAGTPRLIQRCECLVDQQDLHLNSTTLPHPIECHRRRPGFLG